MAEELREYRTDRLYRARTVAGQPLLIHALVEHKSMQDPRVALQLLGYKTRILEWWDATAGRDADGHLQPLPVVLSMVVYHGKAPWRVPSTLAEATNAGHAFHPYLADFRYILVDLGQIDDVALSRNEVLRTGFLILKYGSRNSDLRETLLTLGRAAYALGLDDLVALVCYMLAEPNEVEAQVLREVLAEIVPGQEDRIMSIAAEQWKAEGIALGEAKGLQQGLQQGQARTLLRQLERRFGSVSESVRQRVSAADIDTLDQWLDRVLEAPTLDAVFDEGRTH